MTAKILTVDDSKTVRIIVRKTFKSYDCEILEAGNGVEGLALAAKSMPDLILLDVTMPVMIHHGLKDRKAPPVQMDVLMQGAGTDMLEFVTYDGGEHGLKDPVQRQRLLEETRDFLKKIR